MDTRHGALILADISGYTHFTRMHYTSLLHAEEIISELLEAVIHAAEFPLQVSQLEGDAVLLFAEVSEGREAEACRDVARQIEQLFTAFNTRERALIECDAGCACDACNQIGQLKLKAVLHFGEYASQRIRTLEEITGPEVKLLHTLIKAPIAAREYILMTDRFFALSGGLEERAPDQQLTLNTQPTLIYFPRLAVAAIKMLPGSGPAFSLRLNQHAFARMFRRKPRAPFQHLISGRLNLIVYLLEGTQSAFNLIRRSFRRDRSKSIAIKPVVLVMLQIDQPPHTASLDPIVHQLLSALIDAAQSPLLLNKLEGDAALMYAVAQDTAPVARAIAQQAEKFYAAFKSKAYFILENLDYSLETRQAIQALHCKILFHFGAAAFKTIRNFDEIAGEDVILIHRLLKSAAPFPNYALMTDRFYQLAGGLPDRTAKPHLETVEGFGDVPLWVYPFSQ